MPHPYRIRPPHPRLAATFALLPLMVGIEIPLVMLGDRLERQFGDFLAWAPALLSPALLLYFGNLLIWRRTVEWTPGRRAGVWWIVAAFVAVIVAAAALPKLLGWRTETWFFALLAVGFSASAIALWLTAWICHDPPEPAKVACPKCGYDLRGQRECRCPECGAEYTVGDLAGRGGAD